MQLWLVRHAVAAEREEFDGPDSLRPLTEKGRRRFRRFARRLIEQSQPPDLIVSSPLLRAAETAAILAKACGIKKSAVQFSDLLEPGVDLPQLLEFIAELPTENIALVGHEPDMSEILTKLIGGGVFRFSKGFVASVQFAAEPAEGQGSLAWFVGPRL
jgi:phosphohistidine phosphatase